MQLRAAVARKAGDPLSLETVEVDGPREGEVLVEIKATGICHTDEYTLSGADPEGLFPAILGHEGAGVVVEVGKNVASLKVGDHVIPLYTPECRQCEYCLSRKTNLCVAIRATQGRGVMPDGTSRFRAGSETVFHYMGTSTFANFTVLPEIALAKIRPDTPFDEGLLYWLRCDNGTRRRDEHRQGRGRRPLCCIRSWRHWPERHSGPAYGGCRANRRRRPQPAPQGDGGAVRHDLLRQSGGGARRSGSIHRRSDEGGADYSFECIGNVKVMRQALECAHRGWGKSIIIGVAGAGQEIATRPFQLVTGRTWMGTAFGGARGRTDVPRIVDWYMDKKINIDDLITHVRRSSKSTKDLR